MIIFKNLQFSRDDFLQNLSKLKTPNSSILVFPKDFVNPDWTHIESFELSKKKVNVTENSIQSNVTILSRRTWGKEDWMWSVCISAKGILSIIHNTNKCLAIPEVNDEYFNTVSFS